MRRIIGISFLVAGTSCCVYLFIYQCYHPDMTSMRVALNNQFMTTLGFLNLVVAYVIFMGEDD